MRYKVDDLTGALLDYAVAATIGYGDIQYEKRTRAENRCLIWTQCGDGLKSRHYSPSTDWAQGGPIIERERITVEAPRWRAHRQDWWAYLQPRAGECTRINNDAFGPCALLAAMRCYVKSRHGEYIDLDVEGA